MSKRIAVPVFPGTNSEDETVRLLRDCGADAHLVHWSKAADLASYDAYVLSGGFAYEDRVRAGAIPAHHAMMDYVIEGAQNGKLVLGICNGAQILLESGLVPGTGDVRRPTAAFTHNGPVPHFICKHVYVKLAIDPARSPITKHLQRDAVIPAWAAHGQGRLAADEAHLAQLRDDGHIAFVYALADGSTPPHATPNASAFGAAALMNASGTCLAIMPHPERDGWNFNHPDRAQGDFHAPNGGAVFFASFVTAVHEG